MNNSHQGLKKSNGLFRWQSFFCTYRRKDTACLRSPDQIRQAESGKTAGLKKKPEQMRLLPGKPDIPQTHLQKICAGENVFTVKGIRLLIDKVSQRLQIGELIHDRLCRATKEGGKISCRQRLMTFFSNQLERAFYYCFFCRGWLPWHPDRLIIL